MAGNKKPRFGKSKLGRRKRLAIINRETGEVDGYVLWRPHGVLITELADHLKPKVLDAIHSPPHTTPNAN